MAALTGEEEGTPGRAIAVGPASVIGTLMVGMASGCIGKITRTRPNSVLVGV